MNTLTRADLRKMLQEIGLTYRQADVILDVMLDYFVSQLKTTGELELSFGTITMKQQKRRRAYKLGCIVEYHRPKFTFKEK
jgi:nucleoid DNA-binding protein